MAEFIILSSDGNSVHKRTCVRIAKKSLVFSKEVEGSTTVPKDRCFYYSEVEQDEFFGELIRLARKIRACKQDMEEILNKEFKKVVVKTTHF
jgi:hypothetical protein